MLERGVHQRSLPLTVTIATQRPQEELGFRTGAVGVPYHYLSDRQMVHEGQQPLVRSPVGTGRSDSALPLRWPEGVLRTLPARPLTTVAGLHHSCSAGQGPHSSGPAHRHSAGCQAESLPSKSAAPHFGQSKSCRGSLLGKTPGSFQAPPLQQPRGSPDPGASRPDLARLLQQPLTPHPRLSPPATPRPPCHQAQPAVLSSREL